jgi:hypothetical protein
MAVVRGLGALSLASAIAAFCATRVAAREPPQGAVADAATLAAAEPLVAGTTCASAMVEELRRGAPANGCAEGHRRVAQKLIRRARRRFGYVERREVELAVVELVLGEARRCHRWPLRSRPRAVLEPADVGAAECKGRRYVGAVAVALVDAAGRREPLPPLRTDEDGRLRVAITALDEAARFAGLEGIDGFDRVELGHDGWAGTIDLRRLRGFVADWHLRWVEAGRGAPGLFAVRHPRHPGAAQAQGLALEARVARQRVDFQAVQAGRMTPHHFLQRHAWSPYRADVERLAGGITADRPRAPEADDPSASAAEPASPTEPATYRSEARPEARR